MNAPVRLASDEAQRTVLFVKLQVPRTTGLFQTVQPFLQLPETLSNDGRLLHVDFFGQRTVQERRLDVDMPEVKIVEGCDCEDESCGIPSGYRRERVVEVLTGYLVETLRYQSCLEPKDLAVFVAFDV